MTASGAAPNGRNHLLAALQLTDLGLLLPHLKIDHLKQGTVSEAAGDLIEQVYFPLSGMISLLAVMEAGNAVETATIGREGAVGVLAGLGGRRATGRAVVQLEGEFSQISAAQFQSAMDQIPAMRKLVARHNDAQVTLVYQVAGCNALHQSQVRLCRWLLQTRDRNDSDVIPLTHEFLSKMLGGQRTTVTMLARELQEIGLIHCRRGRIEIDDRRRLEQKANTTRQGDSKLREFFARRKIERDAIRLSRAQTSANASPHQHAFDRQCARLRALACIGKREHWFSAIGIAGHPILAFRADQNRFAGPARARGA
jgi:CRP-like cAMP-binding protein